MTATLFRIYITLKNGQKKKKAAHWNLLLSNSSQSNRISIKAAAKKMNDHETKAMKNKANTSVLKQAEKIRAPHLKAHSEKKAR